MTAKSHWHCPFQIQNEEDAGIMALVLETGTYEIKKGSFKRRPFAGNHRRRAVKPKPSAYVYCM